MENVKYALLVVLWAAGLYAECVLDRNVNNPFPHLLKVTLKNLFICHAVLLTPRTAMAAYSPFLTLVDGDGGQQEISDLTFRVIQYEQVSPTIKVKCSETRMPKRYWAWPNRDESWFEVTPPFEVTMNSPYVIPRLDDLNGPKIRKMLSRFENSRWYEPCVLPIWAKKTFDANVKQAAVRIVAGEIIEKWIDRYCEARNRQNAACRSNAAKFKFFATFHNEDIANDELWTSGTVVYCWGQAVGHLIQVVYENPTAKTGTKVLVFESMEDTVFYIRNTALSEWPELNKQASAVLKKTTQGTTTGKLKVEQQNTLTSRTGKAAEATNAKQTGTPKTERTNTKAVETKTIK